MISSHRIQYQVWWYFFLIDVDKASLLRKKKKKRKLSLMRFVKWHDTYLRTKVHSLGNTRLRSCQVSGLRPHQIHYSEWCGYTSIALNKNITQVYLLGNISSIYQQWYCSLWFVPGMFPDWGQWKDWYHFQDLELVFPDKWTCLVFWFILIICYLLQWEQWFSMVSEHNRVNIRHFCVQTCGPG